MQSKLVGSQSWVLSDLHNEKEEKEFCCHFNRYFFHPDIFMLLLLTVFMLWYGLFVLFLVF